MMLDLDGTLVNMNQIVKAEVESSFYVNGSSSCLVVTLMNGQVIRRRHGYGFDAFKTLEQIKSYDR